MKKIIYALPLFFLACKSDQEIQQLRWDQLALVSGDFDNMADPLNRLGVGYTEFEGYISQPVYNPEIDPDNFALKVEGLLLGVNDSGVPVMNDYDALFISSGTRGLGQYQYNGVEEDNFLVNDPQVIENLLSFGSRGKSLVVSDWAGDLVEATWPDKIQFVNEDKCEEETCWDVGQMGTSEKVIARVVDSELQDKLGSDSVSLTFDFSYWSVMESVSDDVKVHLRGDVEYRISNSEGYGTLEDIPLLVSFPIGGGILVFSSFHWSSQNSAVSDVIMLHVAEGLTPKLSASTGDE
jgi:hypothetical protein